MNNLNLIIIEGRLTKDPELNYTSSGTAYSNIPLAVNRKYKETEEVSFFDVSVWQKTAETCQQYLTKGSLIRIQGRLKQDRWEDDNNQKRSSVKIIADRVDFISTRNNQNGE